jgi:hypothetical protein
MKRTSFTIPVLLLILGVTFGPMPSGYGATLLTAEGNAASVDSRFHVEGSDPDCPLIITIIDARVDGSSWKARIALRNSGARTIRDYDIDVLSHYDNLGEVYASILSDGRVLEPGQEMDTETSGGFADGLLCGRPVGELQSVVFTVRSYSYRRARGTDH